MNYQEISQYINAAHLYADVTDAEYAALAVNHYMTVLGGVRYVGTNEAIEALAAKEIVKPVEEVQPAEEVQPDQIVQATQ